MATTITINQLTEFSGKALRQVGLTKPDSELVADALVTADSMGIFTHGTKLLAGYLRRLQGGGYQATVQPRIERQGAGWALMNGESALGQIGGMAAMRLAMAKARQVGMAYVGLRNAGHFGAIGYYAMQAALDGMLGIVVGNDIPSVAAPGSRRAVLGSNPFAYAIPVPGHDPIILDMATAAVAGGKVYAAYQRHEPIPGTWLIGEDGAPTTDGSLYPAHAALAPMAGHKGYGLALWAEVLSAIIPGGAMTWQVGSWMFDEPSLPSRHNAAFIAMDIDAMSPPDAFAHRMRDLIDEIHAAPTAEGVDRVLVPGEREWITRHQAQVQGVSLPDDVVAKLREVTELTNVSPTWPSHQ